MRRLALAGVMVAMLGIGMLAGSLLTPTARAQKPTVTETTLPPTYTPGVGTGSYVPYYPYSFPVPVRWQVIVVPNLERPNIPVTILLDSASGDSFLLDSANGRYYWSRITR